MIIFSNAYLMTGFLFFKVKSTVDVCYNDVWFTKRTVIIRIL